MVQVAATEGVLKDENNLSNMVDTDSSDKQEWFAFLLASVIDQLSEEYVRIR